jgi:hypothetical protein
MLGSARSTSNEGDEVFDRDARLADECAQRALGDLPMVGDREPAVRRQGVAKDDVATTLAIELVPELSERGDGLAPGDAR